MFSLPFLRRAIQLEGLQLEVHLNLPGRAGPCLYAFRLHTAIRKIAAVSGLQECFIERLIASDTFFVVKTTP